MKTSAMIAAAVLSLAATAASAQVYGGLALGMTHISADCSGGFACDKSDTGFKVLGGYKFGNGFSAEASYIDYGRLKISAGGGSASLRGSGFGIGGAYMVDFAPAVTGSFRLGIATNRTKVSGPGGSSSENSTQPYLGFGLGYKLTPAATVELAYDTSRLKFQGETGTARMISLGLIYAF